MNDDPTCELRHAEVTVKHFRLAGRHTFSSVLAQLPSYLAGRTADDLSPINAFSVLLHLCNENVSNFDHSNLQSYLLIFLNEILRGKLIFTQLIISY